MVRPLVLFASNHRVHHAVNDNYLDRNYGGVLIVWDRIFGSFKEEGEKCVYGTRSPLNSWDPLWSNAEVYWALAKDSWHARNWLDKLRVWFKPPGRRPADAAGAGFFMASDSLLAVNKFAFPLPMAQFWVLATYYVAQILIACNSQPTTTAVAPHSANNSPALFGGATPR